MYSESSPHFGGVQSFQERIDIFGRREVVESFRLYPHTHSVVFITVNFTINFKS